MVPAGRADERVQGDGRVGAAGGASPAPNDRGEDHDRAGVACS